MKLIKNPYVLLTLAMLFWAGNFVLSKAVVVEVRPVTLAFGRWGLAFLVVLPFAYRHLRRDSLSLRRAWKVLIPISLLGITCFNTFIYVGLQTTTAINSLLLQSFFPVVVPVLAFGFFREKLGLLAVVGILVSLLGTLWLVAQGDLERLRSASFSPGDGWVFNRGGTLRRLRAAAAVSAHSAPTELSGSHLRAGFGHAASLSGDRTDRSSTPGTDD